MVVVRCRELAVAAVRLVGQTAADRKVVGDRYGDTMKRVKRAMRDEIRFQDT